MAKRILLADDDAEWRALLQQWLAATPHRLFFAERGRQLIPLAEECLPDCIVLDFELGDQTALEICQTLRQHPRFNRIPIIILTNHTSEKLHAYRNCQADHFIVKNDCGQEELLAVLEATLRRITMDSGIIEHGDTRLDPTDNQVYHEGVPVAKLSEERFAFLAALLASAPRCSTYEVLLESLPREAGTRLSMDALRMLALRTRKDLPKPLARRIRNVKGLGWRYLDNTAVMPS